MFLGERHEIQLPPQDLRYLAMAICSLIELPPEMVTVYGVRNEWSRQLRRIEEVPSLVLIERSLAGDEQLRGKAFLQAPAIAEMRRRGDKFNIQYNPRFINPNSVSDEVLRRSIETQRIHDQSRN